MTLGLCWLYATRVGNAIALRKWTAGQLFVAGRAMGGTTGYGHAVGCYKLSSIVA